MPERGRPTPERTRPLPKTRDDVYPFRGTWDKANHGLCRVRVFQRTDETPVIVCTERPANPSTSVTNLAEVLAAEIVARHFPLRFDFDEPVIWLEYSPALHDRRSGKRGHPRFDRVTFASWAPRRIWLGGQARISLGEPTWEPAPLPEVAALIGAHELDDPVPPDG
jgi:hypothetical protein